MVAILAPPDATAHLAIRYAMMAAHILIEDDADEYAERYGVVRLTEMTLLLYERHARGTVDTPGAFLRSALHTRFEFNPSDAMAIRPLYDAELDAMLRAVNKPAADELEAF